VRALGISTIVVGWSLFGCGLLGCGLLGCGEDAPRPLPPSAPRAEEAPHFTERYHVAWDATARDTAIREGTEAMTRLECNRCHTIDAVEPAGRSAHCVSCHHWMRGLTPEDRTYRTLSERYGEAIIQRYQRNIEHYQEVPDLTGIAHRLRPSWIRDFLPAPHDLRPSMDETMVRVRMSEEDVRAVVRYFAAVAEVGDPYGVGPAPIGGPELTRPTDERIEAGRVLFTQRGCNLCHLVGNVDVGRSAEEIRAAGLPARLAPNLRFVRERMDADIALQWILDPTSIHPTTTMPNMHLSREEAETLRDFLFFVDPRLEPTPAASVSSLPAVLDRPVGWAEVKERVLGRICVHCHMNDHERDPGPGNVGGYGWPAAGLRMRTYELLVSGVPCEAGSVGEVGGRCSVLAPRAPGGLAPILDAMLRRRPEEFRDAIPAMHDHPPAAYPDASVLPGMPMGLPHIPDDELALVRTWIEQGCPGPTEVTGMPGIADGFLVPDGPIEVNSGCGVRLPSETRPAWSTQPPPPWAVETPSPTHGSPAASH
jgi:cbb3-type cytochrome oxidase cytochrome c subunit